MQYWVFYEYLYPFVPARWQWQFPTTLDGRDYFSPNMRQRFPSRLHCLISSKKKNSSFYQKCIPFSSTYFFSIVISLWSGLTFKPTIPKLFYKEVSFFGPILVMALSREYHNKNLQLHSKLTICSSFNSSFIFMWSAVPLK